MNYLESFSGTADERQFSVPLFKKHAAVVVGGGLGGWWRFTAGQTDQFDRDLRSRSYGSTASYFMSAWIQGGRRDLQLPYFNFEEKAQGCGGGVGGAGHVWACVGCKHCFISHITNGVKIASASMLTCFFVFAQALHFIDAPHLLPLFEGQSVPMRAWWRHRGILSADDDDEEEMGEQVERNQQRLVLPTTS